MTSPAPTLTPPIVADLVQQAGTVSLGVLLIGSQASALFQITDGVAASSTPLPIGAGNLCPGPFRRTPPSPVEMEQAIQIVEDVVMPLGASIDRQQPLAVVVDPALAPGEGWSKVGIDTIESAFQHLSALSEGRPLRDDDPLRHREAAAALLIVREAAHHWGLTTLLLPGGLGIDVR